MKEKVAEVLAGVEAKGQPLSKEEVAFAMDYLSRLIYRIRHSDPQEVDGKMTATYYISQGIHNVREYLTRENS